MWINKKYRTVNFCAFFTRDLHVSVVENYMQIKHQYFVINILEW